MKTLKEIFTNKIAYLTVLFHLLLCAIAVYQRGGLNTSFHFIYEPLLFQLIFLLDIFWVLLTDNLFFKSDFGFTKDIGNQILIIFGLASIQWFVIGIVISELKNNKMK